MTTLFEILQEVINEKRSKSMAKTCKTCGKEFPANLRWFERSNKTDDKLTDDCRMCLGEEITPMSNETLVGAELFEKFKTEQEGQRMKPETKVCPCGATIIRHPEQGNVSWMRIKYCEKHAGMSTYQREKFFKGLVKESELKAMGEVFENPTRVEQDVVVEPAPKTDPEFLPEKKDPAEKKTCTNCGNAFPKTLEFFQAGKKSEGGLDYLCKTCRNKKRRAFRAKRSASFALDISLVPGIMEVLEERAKETLRTPEAMALWMLKEALEV